MSCRHFEPPFFFRFFGSRVPGIFRQASMLLKALKFEILANQGESTPWQMLPDLESLTTTGATVALALAFGALCAGGTA
jgi:hypothetical protein